MGQLDPQAQQILNQRNGAQPAQSAPQPAVPSRGGAPGIIQGAPKPVDPMEVERLRLQQEAADRAAAADARSQQSFDGTGGQGTEAQNKGAVLLGRITGGAADITDIINTFPEAERPGLTETLFYGSLGPESVIARSTTDWQRRAINDVQRDIVDALLTMGTGAAYNQEQLEAMRVSYFPQYGDSPEEMAYKRRRLQRMIETARLQAGPNAARLDEALIPLMGPIAGGEQAQSRDNEPFVPAAGNQRQQQPTEPELQNMTMRDMYPNGAELNMDTWGRDEPFDAMQYLEKTYGITQSDERRLVGALNSRMGDTNFSADDVRRIYGALEMPLPDDVGIQQIVNDVHAGAPFSGIDTSAAEEEYKQMLDRRISEGGGNPEATTAGIGQGAVQGMTFGLGDELRGVGGAINAAVTGQDIGAGYQAERDLMRRENERAREASPVAYTTSEIVGALGTGGVRAAPAAMRATSPIKAAAREGAILGGTAGFGYGEGTAGSTTGALAGATTGAGVGVVLQKAAPLVGKGVNAVRGKRPDASEVTPVMEAGARRGVTVRRANVDPSVRGRRANVLQGDKRETIRNMEAQDAADMNEALLRDTGGGRPRTRTETGEMAAGAIERQRAGMKTRAGALYTRADNAAGGVTIAAPRAVAAIDAEIARLEQASASGNKTMIGFLREQRDELANGSTVAGLRDRRTDLRSQLTERGLDANRREAAMQKIYDELSADIGQGLAQSGNKRAQRAYAEADRVWRERADFTKEVRERLLGKRGDKAPGNVASAIKTMAANDPDRLRRFIDVLEPDELADFRATTAQSLGSNSKNEFSVATFLSNTSGGNGRTAPLMDARSMRLVFGKEGMEAIADLRVIGKSMMDAADGTNTSNTGGIVRRATNGLRTLMYGALGLSEGGMTGGALAMGVGSLINKLGEGRSVRLLTNPDFTKWLRSLPNSSNPRAIDGAFDRLRRVASRNSVFAADVQALERQLIGAANDNAGNLSGVAANEDPEQQN